MSGEIKDQRPKTKDQRSKIIPVLDTATATEMVKNTHTHRIVFSNAPIEASLGKKVNEIIFDLTAIYSIAITK